MLKLVNYSFIFILAKTHSRPFELARLSQETTGILCQIHASKVLSWFWGETIIIWMLRPCTHASQLNSRVFEYDSGVLVYIKAMGLKLRDTWEQRPPPPLDRTLTINGLGY